MEMAEQYLARAFEHLEKKDPYDAAEKIWAAVRHATTALAEKYLGVASPPEGWTWRRFVKEAFLKAGLSEKEAEDLAAYFIDVRKSLHGDCFYGLFYEESEHKPLMERVSSTSSWSVACSRRRLSSFRRAVGPVILVQ
jgi:plasmid stabilization system protein ParE